MVDAPAQIKVAHHRHVATISEIIRSAYLEVAEQFDLNRENCPKHPSNCTDQWIQRDLDRGVTYFLLELAEKPLGCAALEVVNDALCYLERVAVLPEYKGKGLGRKLVGHVINQARQDGMKEVGIGIIAKQQELGHWYQKIGFEKGETKHFDHLPFEVLFMTYRIE